MEFETRRKIIHIAEGTLVAGLIYYDLFMIPAMTILLGAGLMLSIYTASSKPRVLRKISDEFDRDEHMDTLPGQGSLFLLAGAILSMAVFDKNVALAAVITLTLGDSLSALVGSHINGHDNPLNSRKSIEGTLTGIIASTSVNTLLLGLPVAFIVSTAGMIVESLHIGTRNWEIDDNLTIPLAVGLTYLVLESLMIV